MSLFCPQDITRGQYSSGFCSFQLFIAVSKMHLFPLLALKNSLLTQKNLIKMLPVLFVTHSWNMAPAVLISARSLLQAQAGFLQCPKKELKLEILCNHSAPPSYALTMCLEPCFFGGCSGSFIATRAFLRCGAWASPCSGFSCSGHGPQCAGAQQLRQGLSCSKAC